MHWSSDDTTRRIFIMLTNNCNLKCYYCYEIGKHIASVNVDAIKQVLITEFSNREYNRYVVSFHGGEPFLAFQQMKDICEWIWENYTGKNISINATTNGTILNPIIKNWLTEHKNTFKIILSLDGKASTHNVNRDNSFEKIDKEFILSLYDERPAAKMTISDKNLSKLYENFTYVYQLGFMPDPSIAAGVDWDIERDLPIFEKQISQLIDFFIEHPQVQLSSIFNIPLHKYSPLFKTNGCGFCGTGETTIAYDVYGNKYPCHTFISNLSKPYDKEEVEIVFQKLQNIEESYNHSSCHECKFSISCSPCFGMNYTKRGNLYALDTDKCAFIKSTIFATAKLYAIALSRSDEFIWLKNKNAKEIMHIALGVKKIISSY